MASKVLLLPVLFLFARETETEAQTDCATVTALIFTCSVYITYGTPNPAQGTPCCDAMTTLYLLSEEPALNRRIVCRCMMGLINTRNSSASGIAALPGLCGSPLRFTHDQSQHRLQHGMTRTVMTRLNSKTSVCLQAFRIIALFCLGRSAV